MRIYAKNICAKFHPNPIWNDNKKKNKNKNKMSSGDHMTINWIILYDAGKHFTIQYISEQFRHFAHQSAISICAFTFIIWSLRDIPTTGGYIKRSIYIQNSDKLWVSQQAAGSRW